jgi:hypothetical protein
MEHILAGAVKLLTTSPNGSDAVTMRIGGGFDEPVVPRIERHMIPLLASRRGSKFMRGSEMRPQYDLRAYIRLDKSGKYCVNVERVTGMAAFSTMIDPSESVGFCEADTPEAAAEGLGKILSEYTVGKGISLTLLSRSYWTDSFAARTFSPDRKTKAASQPRRWRDRLSPLPDPELEGFINEVVAKAFAWGDGAATAKDVSLWWTADQEYKSAYITVEANDDGTYNLTTEDRIPWPWIEKKTRVLRTLEAVQAAIGKYMVANHRFKLKSLSVYFNRGERLAA